MTNAEWATAIIAAYSCGAVKGRYVWTYGDMAAATGRKGQHRLMGGALDLVREICAQRGIPDCATMIVNKEELKAGTLKPSADGLQKHGGWPQLRQQQAACFSFDWSRAI